MESQDCLRTADVVRRWAHLCVWHASDARMRSAWALEVRLLLLDGDRPGHGCCGCSAGTSEFADSR